MGSSDLLAPLFTGRRMGEIFSDQARLQGMLDFEAGLARAEARAGIIPAPPTSNWRRRICRISRRPSNTTPPFNEVLLQTAVYCRVPAANSAFHLAEDEFQKMDGLVK